MVAMQAPQIAAQRPDQLLTGPQRCCALLGVCLFWVGIVGIALNAAQVGGFRRIHWSIGLVSSFVGLGCVCGVAWKIARPRQQVPIHEPGPAPAPDPSPVVPRQPVQHGAAQPIPQVPPAAADDPDDEADDEIDQIVRAQEPPPAPAGEGQAFQRWVDGLSFGQAMHALETPQTAARRNLIWKRVVTTFPEAQRLAGAPPPVGQLTQAMAQKVLDQLEAEDPEDGATPLMDAIQANPIDRARADQLIAIGVRINHFDAVLVRGMRHGADFHAPVYLA
jgi:hypothetical protein